MPSSPWNMKPRRWKPESASALRTGDVFKEISTIAQRSAELAQTIASSAANQTALTDLVGRSIKDFTGGAVATQKATDSARATVEDTWRNWPKISRHQLRNLRWPKANLTRGIAGFSPGTKGHG